MPGKASYVIQRQKRDIAIVMFVVTQILTQRVLSGDFNVEKLAFS